MVLSSIRNFFRTVYLLIIDMYNFPEIRGFIFTTMKAAIFEKKPSEISTIHGRDGHPVPVVFLKGKCLPPLPSLVKNTRNYDKFHPRGDDVWIVNWPKSGTHWMWEVVMCLTSGEAQLKDEIKETTMFPEFCPVESLDGMPSPRVLDTHVQREVFPEKALETSKIIYTVRNPKDALVSSFFHISKDNIVGYNGNWDGFVAKAIEGGEVPYGSWYDHVEGWLEELQNRPNALVVTYEDMIKDLKKQVRRIAEFIDYPNTEEFYSEVARVCSFGHMQKSKREPKSLWKPGGTMYRKGIVGDWKNMFTVAQNEEFDAIYQEKLENLNIKIDFEVE